MGKYSLLSYLMNRNTTGSTSGSGFGRWRSGFGFWGGLYPTRRFSSLAATNPFNYNQRFSTVQADDYYANMDTYESSEVENEESVSVDRVSNQANVVQNEPIIDANGKYNARALYNQMNLASQDLKFEVFEYAIEGYNNLTDKGNGKLGIFDTSQTSDKERYYLIDIKNQRLIGRSVVKTGSGNMDDVRRANRDGSHATLSGFLKVGTEYHSAAKNRQSMHLIGLEKGINDHAQRKAVVVHRTTSEHTWGCIGFSPVMKNGAIDVAATDRKMRELFPTDTIIFTKPTDANYKQISGLYNA